MADINKLVLEAIDDDYGYDKNYIDLVGSTDKKDRKKKKRSKKEGENG